MVNIEDGDTQKQISMTKNGLKGSSLKWQDLKWHLSKFIIWKIKILVISNI